MKKYVNNRISELITRHCLGVSTAGEEAELQNWRSVSESNEKIFSRICSQDFTEHGLQHTYRSDEEHQHQKNIIANRINRIRLRRRFVRYSSAAAVLMLAVAVLMFVPGKKGNYPVIEYQSVVLK
ncbi:MAG: hypothetical protein PHT63_06305, partial [Bacteroidales bacterium]|nr:hypothetical protein [Bacteroidales bacterium]